MTESVVSTPNELNPELTFLFTDIAGSTRLWEQHASAMEVALARHDEIMRRSKLGQAFADLHSIRGEVPPVAPAGTSTPSRGVLRRDLENARESGHRGRRGGLR